MNNHNNRVRDPGDTQCLDELLKFINGTEDKKEQEKSSKAAKRARQKQRKAEEKAERLRKEQEQAEREREKALNAANKEKETKATRRKKKKEKELVLEKRPDLNLIREPPAGKEDEKDSATKNAKLKDKTTGKNCQSNSSQPVGKVKEESSRPNVNPQVPQKNGVLCVQVQNKHFNVPQSASEIRKATSSPSNSPKQGKMKPHSVIVVKSSPVDYKKMYENSLKEVPKNSPKENGLDPVHDKTLTEDSDPLNKKSKKQQPSSQRHQNNHIASNQSQSQSVQKPQPSVQKPQPQSSKLPPPLPPQSPRQQNIRQVKQPVPQQVSRQIQNQQLPRQQSPRQQAPQSPRQQASQQSVRHQAPVTSRQPAQGSPRQPHQVRPQPPSSPRQPQVQKSQPSVSRQQQLQFKDPPPVQQNGTPVDLSASRLKFKILQNGTTDVFKQPSPVNKVEKSTHEDKKSGKVKKPEEVSPQDQVKSNRNRKNKKKNKNSEDLSVIDEIFMPKSESDLEGGEMDEVEKELEEFKRFCLDSTPVKREKLQVNMNLKDIFVKKKSGLGCS